jgi:4-amino-4-deoxy-L-arabinose transferase-like glycosyltransferase
MKSEGWGRDLLILTLLLGVLFGFKLGDRALWSPDEGHYSEIAREMVVSGDYLIPRLAGMKFLEKPPLFSWLESAAIRLFGIHEWSLRLWPAVLAVVGCLAVYLAGRKIFGRRTGLISAAVLATSGLWFVMGHLINLDMAVSALLTCALLAFLLGSRETPGYKRRLAMWAFFVFSAFATFTKGLIGIVIPGLVIGTWMLLLSEWSILKTMYLPSGLALFLLIVAPWYILVSQVYPEYLRFYFIHEHFQRYLTKPDGPFQQPWAFIPVVLLGLFPWTVFLAQAVIHSLHFPWEQRHRHKELIFLILWAGWVLLFFSGSSYKQIPYILPMFPPLAILIGRYIAAAWSTPRLSGVQSASWILVIALSLVVIAGLAGPQHYLERYSNWPSLEVPNDEATIVSTQQKEYGDLSGLTAYLYVQTGILVVAFVAALLLGKRQAFRWGFMVLTLAWASFLVVSNSSLSLLDDRRSVKTLSTVLKSQLQPTDEVATYHAYYQDLPVYLQRPVNVVGWKGYLEFGVQVDEHAGGWMVDDATFWNHWYGPATVYALTDRASYDTLRVESKRKIYPVAQTAYDVLFSNNTGHHVEADNAYFTRLHNPSNIE